MAIIEGALVFPVVFFCLLAIIETGLFFATSSTTNNAARDGARYAAANFGASSDKAASATAAIADVTRTLGTLTRFGTPVRAWVYRANAAGEPIGSTNFNSCSTSCFQYAWNGSAFVYQSGTWTNPDACSNDAARTVDSIGVYVRVTYSTVAGLIDARTIDHHTTLRLEPLPLSQCN